MLEHFRQLGARAGGAADEPRESSRPVLPPPPPMSPTPAFRPWEPPQPSAAPAGTPPRSPGIASASPARSTSGGSSFNAFIAYLFGEQGDDAEALASGGKGRARVCCAMPRVPSLLADDDD